VPYGDTGCLPAMTRRRGNPYGGHPIPPAPVIPTEFEAKVRQLRLTAAMYTSSAALRSWCEQNVNRYYVPEWLLQEWCITVDPNFSDTRDHWVGRKIA
jgi:hypothetical protein